MYLKYFKNSYRVQFKMFFQLSYMS